MIRGIGYLYFHAAPNAGDFHQECVRRVKNLHTSDCLRANKSTMAWGLEARVPFLDKAFLEVAMNVDPKEKMFNKGSAQEFDEDGRPRMEKVRSLRSLSPVVLTDSCSILSVKRSTSPLMARY